MTKIGYAVTGSFCTFSKTLVVMQALVDKGYELVPIFRIIPAISTHAFIRRKIFIPKRCGLRENIRYATL